VSNRRKLRPRLTRPVPAQPQLRSMTVRNERGEDVSWLFGVPPELRAAPQLPGAAALVQASRGWAIRHVDHTGAVLFGARDPNSTESRQ
jgi:hypothetical protein